MRVASPEMCALLCIVCMALNSCSSRVENHVVCTRQFTDSEIKQKVMDELDLVGDYELNVNWSKCKYYLLIFTPSRAPDSEIIVTLDELGRIIDGPR